MYIPKTKLTRGTISNEISNQPDAFFLFMLSGTYLNFISTDWTPTRQVEITKQTIPQ
jgi:hypothetical protein